MLSAPAAGSGRPIVRNYDHGDFGGEVQNWDVVQDESGVVYFANNAGVLEFDGRTWRIVELPSRVEVWSLATESAGERRVFVGARGDFGYLRPDHVGQVQFQSLLPVEAKRKRGFDEIITPVVTPSGIYFHLRNSICRWNEGELRCRETEAPLSKIFAAAEKAYVHQPGTGLMQIVESSLRVVPGGDRFANEEITFVLAAPGGENRLLVGTRRTGLFLQKGQLFEPFGSGVKDPLGQDQLLNGTVLPDGSFAFATRLRGVLITDGQGQVLQQIDRSTGLQDNHVHAMWLDRQGGLWLALQYGISRIELGSPFSIFDEGAGLEREWREVVRHKGILYVRGYKGLFAMTPSRAGSSPASRSAAPRFHRVAGVEAPVWAFVVAGEDLLVSSRDGIHAVRGHRVRRIVSYASRPMALFRARTDPNRVYVGLVGGLNSLRLVGDSWHDEGRIDGIDETITSIAEAEDGDLWLISQAQRAMRVRFGPAASDGRRRPVAHIQRFDPETLSGRVAVREIGNRPVFLTETAVLEFDAGSERFVPVPGLAVLVEAGHRSFSSIAEDPHGNIWVASRNPGNVDFLWKQPDGRYLPDNSGLRQIPAWSIYPDTQGSLVWFCTPEHLLRYDPSIRTPSPGTFTTLIRRVTTAGDAVVSGGAQVRRHGAEGIRSRLPFHDNSVRFEFAAPTYDDAGRNEFQSYLEGFDTAWSGWSKDGRRAYTNLPEGHYRFRARARDVRGQVGDEAVFAFTVLPPWYRTAWAYGLFAGLLGGCLVGVWRVERRRARLKIERERERIELEKLREIDRLKSRFFADVSHEFRTPITMILGPVGQMLEETTAPEVREKLQGVRQHAHYLLRLISQLLDLSKLESRRMGLRAAAGDLAYELRAVVMQFAALAESHGLELKVETHSTVRDRAPVYFDRDVLEKILNNLLGNALKFTGRGGTLCVILRDGSGSCPAEGAGERDSVEIVVSDTGIGIPREHLPHVFDRFYQIEGARSREGFGIGLALVKELVDLHHGSLSVQSEEGRGTTFIVGLPRGKEHLKAEEIVGEPFQSPIPDLPAEGEGVVPAVPVPTQVSERGGNAEHGSTVLVVEDHDQLRGFLREQLQRHYQVIEARDGTEGLERALAVLPGLVLSDVMMPGLNGYELCRALKTGQTTAHIPVVLLTARASREDRLQGLGTGADCYLVKPFEPPELLVQVRNLIEQRRLLRQRFSGSVILKPSEIAVVPADEAFLDKVLAVVERHLEDPEFDVEGLSRAVGLSRSQLHRKLRGLTRQPPTILIRAIRLQRSAELLAGQAGSVAEIAYRVGFSSQAYFAKCFREQFGCSPKEYREVRLGSHAHPPPADGRFLPVRRG